MSVSKIMTSRVVSVHLDDNLEVVRQIFASTRFHHLLVIEDEKLYGVLSDRDLLKSLSPFLGTFNERHKDRALLDRKVHQIMTREVITICVDQSIVQAIELFNRHRISCLPVVDRAGKPVGIISWRDIMRYMEQQVKTKRNS
jgi:acetoin utilization protein AcuB